MYLTDISFLLEAPIPVSINMGTDFNTMYVYCSIHGLEFIHELTSDHDHLTYHIVLNIHITEQQILQYEFSKWYSASLLISLALSSNKALKCISNNCFESMLLIYN